MSLNLYCKNIVKITLRWSYFKFISIGLKQNLGSRCSKFYFKSNNNNNKNYIFFLGGQARGFIWTPWAGYRANPDFQTFLVNGLSLSGSYSHKIFTQSGSCKNISPIYLGPWCTVTYTSYTVYLYIRQTIMLKG